MAAYAAVVSLMNTIDSIHNHPLHYSSLEKKQIQSLQKIIGSLLDFIESNNCHGGSKEEENLESRIASAARTAEDVIESHVVDQILGETSSTSLLDLERVLKDMNSVKEEVMQFKEFKDQQPPSYSMSAASSKPLSTTKNVMVGFDDELELLMDRLTGQQPNLQIIPIVGMSGIEDHKIHLSRLIKLLVAEGFLKTSKVESLEEVAHDYLKDLVGRNLILVSRRRWNGRIQYCKMHDLVREVCLRIAEKEKFFYVMRVLETPPGICKERRIVFYSDTAMKEDQPQVYRFSSRANRFKSNENPLQIKAGRVLPSVNFESLEAIFQQVNLRYLAYEPSKSLSPEYLPSKLHSSVSLLWNMQTLVIRGATKRIDAPSEIWSMRQLRHLQFNEIFLPEPPPSDKQDHLLPNLQTLSKVVNFSFTEEACKRIPNIKKLRMEYDGECQLKCHYYLNNLASFHKLQSLNCSFDQVPKRGDLLHSLVFPSWLKKLCLRNCLLHWEDVNTFGLSLPHLEVLKLADRAVVGPEWHAVEGAFPRLKYLKISCQDLLKWTAEDSDFPVLEKLHLQYLFSLEKIPSGFGEIHTLGYLYVQWCSVSAAISSTEILEEQLSLGNDDLQVAVTLMMKHEEDRFKEMAEIESFTTKNFHYDVSFTSESFKPIGKPPFQYVATVLNKKI
ncbi:hypothetical protein ACS0TY_007053 [Phlomoides rotata]